MAPRSSDRLLVGSLRPSQLIHTYGPGAITDLPGLSVTVMGLDDWDANQAETVGEERLLAAVRRQLGDQVRALRMPPYLSESRYSAEDAARVGVPVGVFPRWMRCTNPRCRRLSPVDEELFTLKEDRFRSDRIRYEHVGCVGGRTRRVVPARFLTPSCSGPATPGSRSA